MKRNKFTSFLLIFCILLTLTSCGCRHKWAEATCIAPKTCLSCGEMHGESLGHDFLPPTYERPATCTRCNDIRGEKLTPVSEWGFYNLSQMGYALVEITSYNLSNSNNAYVVATGSIIKFENGYKLRWGFTVENNKCVFSTANSPESYTIVNNDNLELSNGLDSFGIHERKTVNSRDNFVVFVNEGGAWDLYIDRWYIPYSLIDWERGVECDTASDSEEYILYLIS